jgi:hypothetical protein
MMHDDLLNIADDLARREQAGRPRQASLRRAISTAYYALFHALADLCADELVGWRNPWKVFTPIYRSLDHGRAKEAFKRMSNQYGSDIALIAQTFILLQERRHTADYDPAPFSFGRAETLELIDQSRQAIAWIARLTDQERLLVAVQLIARPRP